jgi:hypothetical protein
MRYLPFSYYISIFEQIFCCGNFHRRVFAGWEINYETETSKPDYTALPAHCAQCPYRIKIKRILSISKETASISKEIASVSIEMTKHITCTDRTNEAIDLPEQCLKSLQNQFFCFSD